MATIPFSSGKSFASTRVNSATQTEELKYESARGEKKPIISGWIISQFWSNSILNNYVQVARI